MALCRQSRTVKKKPVVLYPYPLKRGVLKFRLESALS
jgi:hypothetical protein